MFSDEEDLVRTVKRLDIRAEPNPAHREALRDRMLATFRKTSPDQATPQQRHKSGRMRRFAMRSKPLRIAAAVAVAACVVLVVLLWTGGGGNGVVLADVLARVEEARTVCYRLTTYRDGEVQEVWEVKYKEPGLMRSEMPGGIYIMDWSNGEGLALLTEQKVAHKASVTDMENHYPRNWLEDLKKIIGSEHAEEVGREDVAGRSATGWRVAEEDGVCTVWADSHSGQLLQVEFLMGNTKMVMSEFDLDRPLDDSLFSLTPPMEYQFVTQSQMKASDPSIDDVALLLHIWASGNNNRFPDRLDSREFGPAAAKADWRGLGIQSQEESTAAQDAISRAFMFLYSRFNWSYAGKGVLVDEKDKAVFWYKPEGSQQYKVIYADFSIREVAEEDLPRQADRRK